MLPSPRPRSGARRVALLALVGLALAGGGPLAGCARRGAAAAEEVPTRLRVQNQRYLDVNVYVLRGGQRIRLGTVTGNSTAVLRIPSFVLAGGIGPLRFLADPIGSRSAPVSEEILVSPGDEVQMLIPPG